MSKRADGVKKKRTSVSLPEAEQSVSVKTESPYGYVSSNGYKMRINHRGKKSIEEALLEYLTKQ